MSLRISSMFLVAFSFLFFGAHTTSACSPAPWSYDLLEKDSMAVVYGEVIVIGNEGRDATLKVESYVGPGEAPSVVHLPSTESSQKTSDDPCPDFSMKFQKGQNYLVFLKEVGDTPALLHSDGTTALEVQGNKAIVNMQNDKEDVSILLQKYAMDHQQEMKTPEQGAPVWGEDNNNNLFIGGGAVLIVFGVILFYLIKRKKAK